MRGSYYNEIDPFAAEMLRNLIKAGHIAPGDVDERSIEDVRPDDLRGYAQCHFFAGVGVWSYALRRAGYTDARPVWTGSCPCQPFSTAGKGAGFADERHLWPHFHWLIEQCRPPIVLGEQVASKDGLAWLDLVSADLEGSGYTIGAVDTCAAGFGAPHIRQRLYWVAHANDEGLEGRCGMRERADQLPAGPSSVVGGLADTDRGLSQQGGSVVRGWPDGSDAQPRPGLGGGGVLGGLADAAGQRQHGRGASQTSDGRDAARIEPERLCDAGGLADANVPESEQLARQRARPNQTKSTGPYGEPDGRRELSGLEPTGPTNGFWRTADWLYCRDGRWRPVGPGASPLVDGAPSRVGRLRAYGNSLNAAQAEGFIRAVMG